MMDNKSKEANDTEMEEQPSREKKKKWFHKYYQRKKNGMRVNGTRKEWHEKNNSLNQNSVTTDRIQSALSLLYSVIYFDI